MLKYYMVYATCSKKLFFHHQRMVSLSFFLPIKASCNYLFNVQYTLVKIITFSPAITAFFNPGRFAVDVCYSTRTRGDTPFGRFAPG